MSESLYNPKPREVYCFECKIYSVRDDANPKCIVCGKKLFTVVRSPLTGLIITGAK